MKKILLILLITALFTFNTASELYRPGAVATTVSEVFAETVETTAPEPIESTPAMEPEAIENTTPEAIEIPEEPQIETVTLSFAGDCTIGDDEAYTWNTFDEKYQKVKDPAYFLKNVKSVFEADDFSLVNLEGTFTKETKKAVKEYRFKGDPAYVDILVKGSIEGVTLANNHTLDYFQKGFDDTVKTLNEANVAYTYFDTYFIKEIKGLRIGFLGYKGWSHEKRSNELLKQHIKQMRDEGVDFIVASYHWGDQKVYYPNALQKRMAHFAIDNGADLVIGHHAHVLQGMEVYKGKNIMYGLGNFCYGGSPNPRDKDTIIYQHILSYDARLEAIVNEEYRIIPALLSSEVSKNNYQPTLASGEEEKRILEKFQKISEVLTGH